jgi:hypothetical protein
VRPGAVVRGVGVAVACLASDPAKRSPILFAGFAGAWFLNKPGLQIATVIPDTQEPWKRATVPFLTSVGAWTSVMLAATTAVRHTKVPVPISAIVLGGGVLAIDSLLTDLGEAREAAQVAHQESGAAEQPVSARTANESDDTAGDDAASEQVEGADLAESTAAARTPSKGWIQPY